MAEDVASAIESPQHKGNLNALCRCGIGMDHNTVPTPHSDQLDRPCEGAVRPIISRPEERVCARCGRRERYHPRELAIIFDRNVPPVTMRPFITEFLLKGFKLITSRETIDKTGMTAHYVFTPDKGPSAEEWVKALEQSNQIRAVVRTLLIAFDEPAPKESLRPPKSARRRRNEDDDDQEAPI